MNSNGGRTQPDRPGETGIGQGVLLAVFSLMFCVYALVMLKIVLFKTIPLAEVFQARFLPVRSVNAVPLRTIMEYLTSDGIETRQVLANIAGNIALFVPSGMFVAFAAGRKPLRIQLLWLLGASVSLEALQFILALGSSDVDDILLNTAGGALGIGVYMRLRKKTRTRNRLLIGMIMVYSLFGVSGISAIAMVDSSLLPFSGSGVEYVAENEAVMDGWKAADADLLGDLAAVGTNEITVRRNAKYVQIEGKSTELAAAAEGGDKVRLNADTKIFVRSIRSEGGRVITRYEAGTRSDIEALRAAGRDALTVRIWIWLSGDDPGLAKALLISKIED
ncbi:VanZ family protein [Paenibacillus macerans]|uniref:VanZ family protein n=1 Tax=Paenibacillus macerans TaxID=44252 RepID=UPI003D312C6F